MTLESAALFKAELSRADISRAEPSLADGSIVESPGPERASRPPASGTAQANAELTTVGRYALLEQIGGGGMGYVHLGSMRGAADFSRWVAIKRLHTCWLDDPLFVSRFKTEIKLTASVVHPNVVRALDVVEERNELFLVMDYVDGVTLSGLLADLHRQQRGLSMRVVVALVAATLHGLHAAHQTTDDEGAPLHIVHRDVSPQNIMIDRTGHVRILDFGVAKALDPARATRVGALSGKLSYMSPEQVHGEFVSCASDVFAAGVVLWEALVGQRLFPRGGMNPGALLHDILFKEVPAPSQLRAGVPRSLDPVVARALHRDPAQRFASAHEFALALEDAAPSATPSEVAGLIAEACASRLMRNDGRLQRGRQARAALAASLERAEPAPADVALLLAERSSVVQRPRPAPRARRLVLGGLLLFALSGALWLRARARTSSARQSEGLQARAPLEGAAAEGRGSPAGAGIERSRSVPLGLSQAGGDDGGLARPLPMGWRAEQPQRADVALLLAPALPDVRALPEAEQRPSERRRRAVRALRKKSAARARGRAAPAPSTSAGGACDPPTYMDDEGIRHFKEGCI